MVDPARIERGRTAVMGKFWALADQIAVSGTNFLATVLIARAVGLNEFGVFSLLMAVVWLASGVQSCLVTQPHNVLGVELPRREYQEYTTSTAISQFFLTVVLVATTLTAAFVTLFVDPSKTAPCLALASCLAASQLQDFSRRLLYTEERSAHAFTMSAVAGATQLSAITCLCRKYPSVESALGALAVGSLAGGAWGIYFLRGSFSIKRRIGAISKNWHFGKWLLGGEILGQWMMPQLVVFLAAATAGTSGAAIMRATQTIFGPSRLVAQMMCGVLPTQLTRILLTRGSRAMTDYVRATHLIALPILGGYCVVAALFARPLLTHVFGEPYSAYSSVVAWFAVTAFLGYCTLIIDAALRARHQTRLIFAAEILASLMLLVAGAALVPAWGIRGLVAGLIAADLVLLILLWRAYGKDNRESSLVAASAQQPSG